MKQYKGIFIGASFAIAFSVFAFTEPTLAPPGGNVAAPVNVSGTAQTKAGDLTVNNFYAKNFSVAPGVSEYNITNVNNIIGNNDLFLKGNASETAPVYIAGSEIKMYTAGTERLTITSAGNVGIGTANPSRAKLETAGMVGNTSALFGLGTQGVSLVSNWPGVAFNSYFSGGVWKSISSGWTGDLSYIASAENPANGGFVFRTGEWAVGPDQIVGQRDVLQINKDGLATFHGPALVMDGVGKGRTDFVMYGDRGGGGRAFVLDWGNTLKINYANDFAGGLQVDSKMVVPGNPIGIRGQLSLGGDYYGWGNRECIGCGDTINGAPNLWLTAQDAVRVRAPNGLHVDNNINANDVFIRASGKWASQMGGITSESDTLQSVTDRGNYTWRDIRIGGRFATQNLSVACPNGWGCGVHTWDVYADSAVGAGNFITAPNKYFTIPHPLDPENKLLIHATLEGPENAVFYRGEGTLTNGRTIATLPHYFEALTRKKGRTALLTNVDGFDPIAVESQNGELVKDGKFIVVSSNKNSSQRFIWEVKAVRADVKPLRVERDKNESPYDEDQLPKGVVKPDYVE